MTLTGGNAGVGGLGGNGGDGSAGTNLIGGAGGTGGTGGAAGGNTTSAVSVGGLVVRIFLGPLPRVMLKLERLLQSVVMVARALRAARVVMAQEQRCMELAAPVALVATVARCMLEVGRLLLGSYSNRFLFKNEY